MAARYGQASIIRCSASSYTHGSRCYALSADGQLIYCIRWNGTIRFMSTMQMDVAWAAVSGTIQKKRAKGSAVNVIGRNMRRRARTDGNQPLIVRALRQAGASVLIMAPLGNGAPDIQVGWRGKNYNFEVKDPTKPRADRCLTPDEKEWHATWNGQVDVIESAEDAFKILEGGS